MKFNVANNVGQYTSVSTMNVELPIATRRRRDMTEKLLNAEPHTQRSFDGNRNTSVAGKTGRVKRIYVF